MLIIKEIFETMSPCIYKITLPSGKSYIGQTIWPLEKCMKAHQKPGSQCVILKNAINKYGWDNMKVEILLHCNKEDLNKYEKEMIAVCNTMVQWSQMDTMVLLEVKLTRC